MRTPDGFFVTDVRRRT